MLTGRSVRPTALAFVILNRAAAILVALVFNLQVVVAAPRPIAQPTLQTHTLTMPDCAGPGATIDVTMDTDYMSDFNGCPFDATVAANGCTATVYIPSSTCVPSTGTVTMATVVVRSKSGAVHAIAVVRAVDGVVNVDIVEV